jgi:hypothetical protein
MYNQMDPGMMGQDPGMMGQDPGMMGQDPGMMGQDPGMMGQEQEQEMIGDPEIGEEMMGMSYPGFGVLGQADYRPAFFYPDQADYYAASSGGWLGYPNQVAYDSASAERGGGFGDPSPGFGGGDPSPAPGGQPGDSDGIPGGETNVQYANAGTPTTGTTGDDTIIVGAGGGSIITSLSGADLFHHDVADGNYEWAGTHQQGLADPSINPSLLGNPEGTSWYGVTNSTLLAGGTTGYSSLNMIADFTQGTDKIEISNSAEGLEAGYNHMAYSDFPQFASDSSFDHGTVYTAEQALDAIGTYFNSGYDVDGSGETGVTIVYIASSTEMLFGIAGNVTLTESDFFDSTA